MVKLKTSGYFSKPRNAIDNHDSGYLGMVVHLYVQAHLEHYHDYIDPEGIQRKTDDTAKIYIPICII